MELYVVVNKSYKHYYTLANNYNEAVEKVKTHIEETAENSVIDNEGSLILKLQQEDKYKVECIGELIR